MLGQADNQHSPLLSGLSLEPEGVVFSALHLLTAELDHGLASRVILKGFGSTELLHLLDVKALQIGVGLEVPQMNLCPYLQICMACLEKFIIASFP